MKISLVSEVSGIQIHLKHIPPDVEISHHGVGFASQIRSDDFSDDFGIEAHGHAPFSKSPDVMVARERRTVLHPWNQSIFKTADELLGGIQLAAAVTWLN